LKLAKVRTPALLSQSDEGPAQTYLIRKV